MKLTRKQLIENAGIFKEGSTDRDAIAHFVWGRDDLMDRSEDELEGLIDELEKEYNASKSNYPSVDDYLEDLEAYGAYRDYLDEAMMAAPAAASEVLSMLAHPDLKKSMEKLADMLDDAEYMAIKKLYDGLYNEVKKYE